MSSRNESRDQRGETDGAPAKTPDPNSYCRTFGGEWQNRVRDPSSQGTLLVRRPCRMMTYSRVALAAPGKVAVVAAAH